MKNIHSSFTLPRSFLCRGLLFGGIFRAYLRRLPRSFPFIPTKFLGLRPPTFSETNKTAFSCFLLFLQKPLQKVLILFSKNCIIYLLRQKAQGYLYYFIIHYFFQESKGSGKESRNFFAIFTPLSPIFSINSAFSPFFKKGIREFPRGTDEENAAHATRNHIRKFI